MGAGAAGRPGAWGKESERVLGNKRVRVRQTGGGRYRRPQRGDGPGSEDAPTVGERVMLAPSSAAQRTSRTGEILQGDLPAPRSELRDCRPGLILLSHHSTPTRGHVARPMETLWLLQNVETFVVVTKWGGRGCCS